MKRGMALQHQVFSVSAMLLHSMWWCIRDFPRCCKKIDQSPPISRRQSETKTHLSSLECNKILFIPLTATGVLPCNYCCKLQPLRHHLHPRSRNHTRDQPETPHV